MHFHIPDATNSLDGKFQPKKYAIFAFFYLTTTCKVRKTQFLITSMVEAVKFVN